MIGTILAGAAGAVAAPTVGGLAWRQGLGKGALCRKCHVP
jgi:hypothetical protein